MPVEQTAALPACKDVFVPGKTVDKTQAKGGCTSPSGTVQIVGSFDCADGGLLWQVDSSTGVPAGYARDGQPYKKVSGEVASDAGYAKAYENCNG